VRFWQRNRDQKFFVSLRYRPLCERVAAINRCLEEPGTLSVLRHQIRNLINNFPSDQRKQIRQEIFSGIRQDGCLTYDYLARIRCRWPYDESNDRPARVRQIAYFTMGGLAHRQFQTNLHKVYVTGEAMHDFGANRVGGLPWALYLVAGSVIAERIEAQGGEESAPADFELVRQEAQFDTALW
jgi:fatty acid CoA ligase FadD22